MDSILFALAAGGAFLLATFAFCTIICFVMYRRGCAIMKQEQTLQMLKELREENAAKDAQLKRAEDEHAGLNRTLAISQRNDARYIEGLATVFKGLCKASADLNHAIMKVDTAEHISSTARNVRRDLDLMMVYTVAAAQRFDDGSGSMDAEALRVTLEQSANPDALKDSYNKRPEMRDLMTAHLKPNHRAVLMTFILQVDAEKDDTRR